MEMTEEALNNERLQAAARFKAFMMKNSTKTNLNLYDHLVRLLTKVMDERPENAVDVIEDMSRELKGSILQEKQDTLRDSPSSSSALLLAEQQKTLFKRAAGGEGDHEEELVDSPLPNVAELAFFFEQAGVGLGKEEIQRIFLALKQLVDTQCLQRCRFWGKILGTQSSYLVAEGEFREGEGEEEQESTEPSNEDEEREEESQEDKDEAELVEAADPPPKSTYMPPPPVPKEENHTGVNKFTYFVCQEPGMPWFRLPVVTPAQITAARQIRRLFSGRLDAPVVSFPPFPGNEANYLRAQIARISAATHISPVGFYQFGEDEGEDEGLRDTFEENPNFEGNHINEMAESLNLWVHHVQHILTQGRCVWVNITQKSADDVDVDEDAEEEEPDEPEPEIGPPLLTPLSEDAKIHDTPPWSSMISSYLIPQFSIAVLRSNLWPGAYAYACESGKNFGNIYIGWGLKYIGEAYTPIVLPPPQSEYPSGPEITEAQDPSVEEEQAFQAALEEETAALEETEDLEDDEDDDD